MILSLSNNTRTVIKVINDVSSRQENSGDIPKTELEKEEFLKHGKIPKLHTQKPTEEAVVVKKKQVAVSFEFLPEAKRILDLVNKKYGSGDLYLDEVFGERITQSEASKYLIDYLQSQGLEGALQIFWSKDITCCGRIMWTGPSVRFNKPEKMKYSFWLKSTAENVYLRRQAIKGLADHEIGTHYLRMRNDGFQPWFSNRKLFGLRSLYSHRLKETEEGFAAVNTLLQLNCRLLWRPAFLYYIACMATTMTFKELFDHLETYIWDPDQRWKHVVRVKRDLENYTGYGGTGKDQTYFAGAVRILRNAENIDFKLLYSGKLCFDELERIKRITRGSVKIPHFMEDMALYRQALREMLHVNGLQPILIIRTLSQRTKKARTKRTGRKVTPSIAPPKGSSEVTKSLQRKERNKRKRFNGVVGFELFSIEQIPPKLVY